MESLTHILPVSGVLLVGIVIGVFAVGHFPAVKLFLSTVFRAFGRTGKWFRRKSIETELEGTMNSFSRTLNRDFTFELLPQCQVQWVTPANQARILQPGKAIVRLSFSGDDYELNFYNAAQAFIETGLLPETKPFLVPTTAKAIDLLMTRLLLEQSRRTALRVFNAKFVDQESNTKATYLKLEESDRESLLRQLLLPELHLFGEAVVQRTPAPEILKETEEFIDWFYELATRPPGEFTKLIFESENIRVGVMLVADPKTYETYGYRPYLRRASLYAARGYQCIYILARGQRSADLAARVGRDLIATGGYAQLNKRTVRTTHKGTENYLITCIVLRPDIGALKRTAWQRLHEDFVASQSVTGVVEHVTEEVVQVDVYGLTFDLSRDRLSSVEIGPAFRFFHREQELQLKVVAIDTAQETATLTNCDTETDPKAIIALVEQAKGRVVRGRIDDVLHAQDFEIGWVLTVSLDGQLLKAFLPRRGVTFSRFVSLSSKLPIGEELDVAISDFDLKHGRLSCRLPSLPDPWDPAPDLDVGDHVTCVIREITENHATCEISEGVEARLFYEELSWSSPDENKQKMTELEVAQSIDAIITRFEPERRYIAISVKRLTRSANQLFFDTHLPNPVRASVESVSSFGAIVRFDEGINGYLSIRDVLWGYCERVAEYVKEGATIDVKLLRYDPRTDRIHVGIKQLQPNDFQLLQNSKTIAETVLGEVIGYTSNSVRMRVAFDGHQTFGYVHRSEISNCFFVDDGISRHLFRRGDEYYCSIKRFDAENQIVELSRKVYLQSQITLLEYGQPYSVRVVLTRRGEFAYSDVVEGRLVNARGRTRREPTAAEVTVSRKGSRPQDVELSL